MDQYTKSQEYLARALKVTPGGAQTLSKRANRFPSEAYPIALERGSLAYVWDMDGHRYLDMICALASMTLGYRCHEIEEAVKNQLHDGVSFSLAHPLEAQVAEKLCAMIPCAEMVRFVKTGSESTEAAIRVARKATGRDIILAVGEGYHAWHSWFQCMKLQHPGIPDDYGKMVRSFIYNDLDSIDTVYRQLPLKGRTVNVAAIMLEPCHYEQPASGFLEGLRQRATVWGCPLIFDCMVTGFRWANGGAQEYFGVTPDLACFGKAMANGFPLACLCGKRELMEHADVVSGTFGGEALSLAACNAVLDLYQHEPIIETLWARGKRFQNGFNNLATVMNVPAVCDGFAVKPRIRFLDEEGVSVTMNGQTIDHRNIMAMSLFLQETARHGVLWHPAGGNVSAVMTKADIDHALNVCALALEMVGKALHTDDWSALQGEPLQASPYVRQS